MHYDCQTPCQGVGAGKTTVVQTVIQAAQLPPLSIRHGAAARTAAGPPNAAPKGRPRCQKEEIICIICINEKSKLYLHNTEALAHEVPVQVRIQLIAATGPASTFF